MRNIRSCGFTLIELVTVIIIVALITAGGTQFISYAAEAYLVSNLRSVAAGRGEIAAEKIARELRNALPYSARSNNQCVEFIPVTAGSTYISLPTTTAAASFQSIPMSPTQASASGRAAVYPVSTADLYNLSNPGPISDTATLSAPDVSNVVTVTLASDHQFTAGSPTQRYFLISAPISFCRDASILYRYQNYGFNAGQLLPAALPNTVPNRQRISDSMDASVVPFSVSAAGLQRNAIVAMDLLFSITSNQETESIRINHEVQLRNIP